MAETHIRKTMKLLEKNMGENLHDLRLGNNFLSMTPKVQATRGKTDKSDLIKAKNFCLPGELGVLR